MWKLNQFIPDDDGEREESLLEEESDGICSLSPTQSLIVFAKPIKFALLFTFGNVLAVGSTAFLIGPERQLGMMFDPVRIYATVIYIGCVVLALIFALLIHSKILTVFAIIFEICALIWYGLSYIPFARRMVSSLMIRLCDTEL
ncbi:PREDICTED: vesicle transport protein SFT2B-like isoform X3 [Populus euphratica]|uniref:Vesicle transport protein n=1 Tax=Populus euphratica TaxID=75702 RepID=A0AAJ6X315_POPEU|nr:PREDICTED: vesicle transport protein SFT2B-like isoform X3 [Populus euphratica]